MSLSIINILVCHRLQHRSNLLPRNVALAASKLPGLLGWWHVLCEQQGQHSVDLDRMCDGGDPISYCRTRTVIIGVVSIEVEAASILGGLAGTSL